MPLVIQYTGPSAAPQIVCDHCGERITNAMEGNYQWAYIDGEDEGTTPLYFTHKHCGDAFEQAHAEASWDAIGLECLPYFLRKNLQLSWREAQASGRKMSGR